MGNKNLRLFISRHMFFPCCKNDSAEASADEKEDLLSEELHETQVALLSYDAINCIIKSRSVYWDNIPAHIWAQIEPGKDILWLDFIEDQRPCTKDVYKDAHTGCVKCGLCINVSHPNLYSGITPFKVPSLYLSTEVYWFACSSACYIAFLGKNDADYTFFDQ